MKDLTVGKPGRVLLAYSLPLFGSIIFQQLYNIADSFVAGHFISTEALAAVGNSSEITLIFIAIAFGCNIGTSVVTANLFGQKEMKQVHTCVTTALIFCGILGVVLSAVGMLTSEWMLTLLDTPVETMKDSVAYIQIYLMSYVFLMLYQVATGIFSALGDSKTPFYFLAVSSITNIFVDILFVRDFHMGVPGVAAYVIVAAVAVPVLTGVGVMPMAAHMFCLFYACLSNITPPVAMSSYVAAGIAHSDQTRTSLIAVKLGLTGFILPFFFLNNPLLLYSSANPALATLWAFATACLGVSALAAGLQGWLFGPCNSVMRGLLLVAAFLAIDPGLKTDLAALALCAVAGVWSWKERGKG